MAVNVDTGSNVDRGPPIVKQVMALAYQKCSSDHSLEGIVKKICLPIHKEKKSLRISV